MRVGVIGAGAIGGTLAALLDREGHDVTVVARSSAQAIRAQGLALTGAFGGHAAHPRVVERLSAPLDVAILATKTMDAASALSPSADALAGVPTLVVQNGLDGHGRAARILGHERVAAGIGMWAASALEPGAVRVTAAAETVVGGREGERFLDLLAPALPDVRLATSIEGAQWTKLCVNMLNAVPAAVGRSLQACAADPGLLRVIAASMGEAARVAIATGLPLERVGLVTPGTVRELAGPVEAAMRVPAAMVAAFGDVPNLGSTQQSIRRGQPTEVDDLNGAVVAEAGRRGLATPVNAALVRLVHEVERTGTWIARDRVAALA